MYLSMVFSFGLSSNCLGERLRKSLRVLEDNTRVLVVTQQQLMQTARVMKESLEQNHYSNIITQQEQMSSNNRIGYRSMNGLMMLGGMSNNNRKINLTMKERLEAKERREKMLKKSFRPAEEQIVASSDSQTGNSHVMENTNTTGDNPSSNKDEHDDMKENGNNNEFDNLHHGKKSKDEAIEADVSSQAEMIENLDINKSGDISADV